VFSGFVGWRGALIAGVRPLNFNRKGVRKMSLRYSSTYETARGVSQLVSLVGWILVAIGVGGVVFLVKQAGGFEQLFSGMGAIGAILSLLVSVAGLLLVTSGQVVRATVDNADNTGQILYLLKNMSHEEK
jgi:hypothetical protein